MPSLPFPYWRKNRNNNNDLTVLRILYIVNLITADVGDVSVSFFNIILIVLFRLRFSIL